VGFAAEMPGRWAIRSSEIPLDDRQLLISALDYKPMNRSVSHDPTDLALEFLQTQHAFSHEAMVGKSV
jgi:hypothetical protein